MQSKVKPSNENAWIEHSNLRDRIYGSPFLRFLNSIRIALCATARRDRFILQNLKRHSRVLRRELKILDVGCGGGRPYLKRFGKVYGVEPDERLRSRSRELYDAVEPGLANDIPFADDSFDVVTIIDVFGHIEAPEKQSAINEMKRVLRPGGILIGFIECDAENPWYRLAKRRPDLFQKYFVERLGHFGLELLTQTQRRFENAGFECVDLWRSAAFFPSVGYLACIFGPEYLDEFKWLRPLVRVSKLLGASYVFGEMLNLALSPIIDLVDYCSPPNHCTALLATYRKPAHDKSTNL